MKSYTGLYYGLLAAIFGMVLGATLVVGVAAEVPPEKRASLIAGSMVIGLIFGLVAAGIADALLDSVPNGKPRLESELQRGTVFAVHSRTDNFIGLWNVPCPIGENPIFWAFEDLPNEVVPGRLIMYLDDPSGLQTAGNNDIVMILSAEGRKKQHSVFVQKAPSLQSQS